MTPSVKFLESNFVIQPMIIKSLGQIIAQNKEEGYLYLRNLLKEQLQFYVLNFVYGSKWGENLIFKGGSALRICFDLPRLSEDLYFDFLDKKSFIVNSFLADLRAYFTKDLQYKDLSIKISSKHNIIYLKFPVLDKLGLAESQEKTKILFLRIDLSPSVGKKYKIEVSSKSTSNFSFVVKRYSLPDFFAGKIAAILTRTTKEGKEIKPRTKGRDYFDLVWFLEKKVQLNFDYLQEIIKIKEKKELKKRLLQKIEELDLKILKQDLDPLFKDKNFVEDFVKNYKQIALPLLENFI